MKTINYCDSSALVKRYLNEFGSAWMQVRSNDINHVIATADISRAEIAAAFAAKRRGGFISQPEYDDDLLKAAEAEGLKTENPNLHP
jgi:predicted nucleic acid-binding protein